MRARMKRQTAKASTAAAPTTAISRPCPTCEAKAWERCHDMRRRSARNLKNFHPGR